jgi:DNA polymerase III subunit beta
MHANQNCWTNSICCKVRSRGKSTIPILSHFLLETLGSRLQISASDLEVGARSSCRFELNGEGKAAVPVRRVVEIIRSLPDGEISFKLLENHWVHVSAASI